MTDRESVLPVLDLIELALCFRQSIFVTTKEAQVFNELAAGESRKDFETNVNADLLGRGFKRLWLNLAGEGGIPLARSRSADSAGLNVAFNPAVKMNGNVANLWIRNLGQAQLALRLVKHHPFMRKAVVDIAADAKRPFQDGDLRLRRGEPVAVREVKGFSHWTFWAWVQNAFEILCIASQRKAVRFPRWRETLRLSKASGAVF